MNSPASPRDGGSLARPRGGPIERASFGWVEGQEASLFTLRNELGLLAKISDYGATLSELHVPDRQGALADVVLGFDSAASYRTSPSYFGAIVGRVANRIQRGAFELGGLHYTLACNDRGNHLHGGRRGFDKALWAATPRPLSGGPALELTRISPAGEEGYPGTLTASVTYQLTHEGALSVEMRAQADRTTIVNLAQHSYFNLAGHGSGSILNQQLWLGGSEYTTEDPDPGVIRPVEGTAFDFRQFKPIGRDFARVGNASLGYDHNFIVGEAQGGLCKVAALWDLPSGRRMTLETDQPGLQVYAGGFLDGSEHGKGARYERHAGLCLESQKFPYAINVPSWRQQVILEAGDTYLHRMLYRFSVL